MIRYTIKKYTNPVLIFLAIIIIITLTSYLYLNNQSSIINKQYCLDNFKSINIDFEKAIIACNKY